ncbi:MAG: hypothetical protein KGL39_15500 [Patescibacteria group bacterium]|nr:hypothetical protein [Patescibacteria group bacterium]
MSHFRQDWSGIVTQSTESGLRSHAVSVTESIDEMLDACINCGLYGQTLHFSEPESSEWRS